MVINLGSNMLIASWETGIEISIGQGLKVRKQEYKVNSVGSLLGAYLEKVLEPK